MKENQKTSTQMIKYWEELYINAYPAVQTVPYDGWLIQFSCFLR